MPAALRGGVLLFTGVLACTPNPRPTVTAAPPIEQNEPEPAPTESKPPAVVVAPEKPKREPVEVVVRDVAGGVIAGAKVIDNGEGTLEQRTHVTDARGVAMVPGKTKVSVEAAGFVTLSYSKLPRRGRAELYLMPASTIAGRVVDERGRPVAGADVQLQQGSWREVAAKTDAEGRVRFEGIEPGRRLLTVRGGVIGDRMVAVGYAETASFEVKVERAVTISGRAVLAGTGAPCSGGTVRFYVGLEEASGGCPICGGEDPTSDAPIADDGTVRLEVARRLTYGVQIACRGAMKEEADPVIVGDGDVSGLRWEVSRGLQIRGMVVDDEGRPLPGMEVHMRSADNDRLPDANGDHSARTDEDGRFSLEGLVGEKYELAAYSETPVDVDYAGKADVTLADADLDEVVIRAHGKPSKKDEDDDGGADEEDEVFPPWPGRVSGVVLDARGKPVAGALVFVDDDWMPDDPLTLLTHRWTGEVPTVSGADGRFEAPAQEVPRSREDDEDDEDDKLGVVAFAPGGAVGVALVGEKPVEVRVRPLGAITVKVRDRRGRPFSHFGVDLSQERPDPEYVHAPGGTFTIPGFLPGSQRVRIHTPVGDVGKRIEVPAKGSPVVVNYEPRGEIESLTIYINDAVTREDVAGCKVAVGPLGEPRKPPVVSDGGGMAEFRNVLAGPVQIDVGACTAPGKRYPAQSVRVQLRPDMVDSWFMPIAGHDAALRGRAGQLGYTLEGRRAGVDPLLQPLRVKAVIAGGPAERAGLKVGDVIVKVGDVDVAGRSGYLHDGLTRVAAGAGVKLGLADGRTIELKAE